MAVLRIPEEEREIKSYDEIRSYLENIGIEYEIWSAESNPGPDASSEEILKAFSKQIEDLKIRGGYTTADVINLTDSTPGLDEMLNRFNKEHWHDEDEVRFTITGRGLFHINPRNGPVVSIEVGEGDLLRIPKDTQHWFDLCGEKHIRAIRLFQNVSGWTPYYTESGFASKFQPVCMGPSYFPPKSSE